MHRDLGHCIKLRFELDTLGLGNIFMAALGLNVDMAQGTGLVQGLRSVGVTIAGWASWPVTRLKVKYGISATDLGDLHDATVPVRTGLLSASSSMKVLEGTLNSLSPGMYVFTGRVTGSVVLSSGRSAAVRGVKLKSPNWSISSISSSVTSSNLCCWDCGCWW